MFCSNFTLVWCFHYFDFSFDLTTNLLYVSNLLCASSQIKHISDGSIIFIDIICQACWFWTAWSTANQDFIFSCQYHFRLFWKWIWSIYGFSYMHFWRIDLSSALIRNWLFSSWFVLWGFLFHLLCHFVRFQFSYLPVQWLCFWIICFWLQIP